MPKTILLLGPPSLKALLDAREPLLNHVLPEFEPAHGNIRLEHIYGSAPLLTLSTLDPNETSLVQNVEPVHIYKRVADKSIAVGVSGSTPTAPPWRILPLHKAELHSGFTQASNLATPSIYEQFYRNNGLPSRLREDDTSLLDVTADLTTAALTAHEISIADTTILSTSTHSETSTTAYLDHSIAIHNLPSSQVSIHTSPHRSPRYRPEDEEYASIYKKLAEKCPMLPHIPLSTLTEIEDLPTACDLVNKPRLSLISLLVGIIAISEPRIIELKNSSAVVQLIILTVGDDTGAGFEVKTWIPVINDNPVINEHQQHRSDNDGVAKVHSLRVGDIVLLEKIGLSIYRDVVSGNTLRGERSKITLVYRDEGRRPKLDVIGDETGEEGKKS